MQCQQSRFNLLLLSLTPQDYAPVMQVCPYDCRHTLATISSLLCQTGSAHQQHLQELFDIFVYEAEPESLARHMLLLVLLFDTSLTPRERAEMFLELHGNVLLRQRTADWLGAQLR